MTTTPALCAAILFTLTAPLAPAGSSPTAPSAPLIQIEQAATTHYRLLLDQLERQFNDLPSAPDQNEATRAITRTMAALASKDVFTDWTAYQGLRLFGWDRDTGPLVTLAIWSVFHERLKSKDESLLRIRMVQEHPKRGLVPQDPAPRFPEPAPTFRPENELALRVYELDLFLQNIRTGMAYFTMFEHPNFDLESPIFARIFDAEFLTDVKADLERRRELRPKHQPNETNPPE